MTATTLFVAELHWVDADGVGRVETHTGAEVSTPTRAAWKRSRSLLRSGAAVAYTTRHHERRLTI